MKISCQVLALTLFTTMSMLAADDWKNLPLIKDGKTAPEWTLIGYGKMELENNTLRTEAAPEGLGLFTYTQEKYGNCQIKVVFKAKDVQANSGVYVRIGDGILKQTKTPGAAFARNAAGTPSEETMKKVQDSADREEGAWYAVHNGYEVQIAGGGDRFHRTGAIYSLASSESEPKPGEWQTLIITLDGPVISVELDGKPVSRLDTSAKNLPERKVWYEPKRENKRPEVGYFGLQTHDPGDVVWYKEVSVRPLKKK